MIPLQARDTLALGQPGGLSELAQRSTIEEGFQDVLLHLLVLIQDGGKLLSQLG
jgi:hypothetical protein